MKHVPENQAAELLRKLTPKERDSLTEPNLTEKIRALGNSFGDYESGLSRRFMLRQLSELGRKARPAAPALARFLQEPIPPENDKDERSSYFGEDAIKVRCQAAELLVALDSEYRGFVASTLRELTRAGSWQAAAALGKIEPANAEVVPGLLQALAKAKKGEQRDAIISAFGQLKAHGRPAVPELVKLLKDPELDRAIASTLGEIGPAASAAIPALLKAAENMREHYDLGTERELFLNALASVGPGRKDIMEDLLGRLDDPEDVDGVPALRALAKMGPAAKVAVPRLEVLLRHKGVWLEAQEALPKIRGPQADDVDRLVKAVQDPAENRETVARLLGQIGPLAKSAVPALRRFLKKNADYQVQLQAISALGAIGPDAMAALSDLLPLLESQNYYWIGRGSAEALGHIGSEKALPHLAVFLAREDLDEESIQVARQAVMNIHARKKLR